MGAEAASLAPAIVRVLCSRGTLAHSSPVIRQMRVKSIDDAMLVPEPTSLRPSLSTFFAHASMHLPQYLPYACLYAFHCLLSLCMPLCLLFSAAGGTDAGLLLTRWATMPLVRRAPLARTCLGGGRRGALTTTTTHHPAAFAELC